MPEPAVAAPDGTTPPDEPARARIRADLDATLFVEAGAGSGKTTALVDRVAALVEHGVPMDAIVAITFTEKAATELRDRIRQRLERLAAHPLVAERAGAALDSLDRAAVGTLHAFAQRILGEHPVEAGLPPRIEVLDEIESGIEFEQRWGALQERLLEHPDLHTTMRLATALGIRLDDLRTVAQRFEQNWDLLDEDPPPADRRPHPQRHGEWAERMRAVAAERHHAPEGCRLAQQLEDAADWAERVAGAASALEATEALLDPPSLNLRRGNKQAWARVYRAGRFADLDELRAAGSELLVEADAHRDRVREDCLAHLVHEIAVFTLDSARERTASGRLTFHDLLVLARSLVRHPDHGRAVRAALHRRYQRLLLDEFQDTDPIQLELAVRIAAPPDASGDSWSDLTPLPGRLFFVGDPKQSIYRFRRADIRLFLEAQHTFTDPGAPSTLTANFRTVAPLVDWVNAVFGRLITASPGSQPPYVSLAGLRRLPDGELPVAVLGADAHDDGPKADEVRAREAADLARTMADIVASGWLVEDPDARPRWRPARLGDIAVLVPSRLTLAFIERALTDAGIAYRAESSSLVYATTEVRDLLLTLRAVDDPSDGLALVAALRSPIFGCSDVDLLRWKERGGAWNPEARRPEPVPDDPVGEAMDLLAECRRVRAWATPSELLERIVARRQVLEQGFLAGRPHDLWRRIRFVIDQARAWSDAGGTGLRRYLAWARLQAAESSRVAEVVLPETDQDAVRIMTIHAAKGLEFPITVVAGLAAKPNVKRGVDVLWPPGGPPAVRLGRDLGTERYEALEPIDEQMGDHERLRLLYVACTRARDHLVVSLHRSAAGPAGSSAALLAEPALAAPHTVALAPLPADPPAPVRARAGAPWPWADPDAWAAARAGALAAAGRAATVSATGLAQPGAAELADLTPDDPGLDKEPVDLELPPWQKGRYGTAIGRAVHAVLQTVDLATGAGVDDAARAQAAAEGVEGRHGLIASLARSALASGTVQEAAHRPHWREVYVGAPFGATVLEGYVDLLYEGPDGLVIVDHKTDQAADEADLDAKVARYRLQGAAYAAAVEQATGLRVASVVFVFCRPDGPATERTLPDLGAAMAEVSARIAATTAGG